MEDPTITPLALGLVLAAAVYHALWTLLRKRAGGGSGRRSGLATPSATSARAVFAAGPGAVLVPPAHVLVVSALVFTQASYMAPAREVSIALAMG